MRPTPPTLWALGATAAAAVVSLILVYAAQRNAAGTTSDVSMLALVGWLVGAVGGLVAFARFRVSDAADRLSSWYVVPPWRPATVVAVVAALGWLAGSFGAYLVAESIARW